jgi:hypothetical protein
MSVVAEGPRVAVEPLPTRAGPAPGQWHAAWRVTNQGDRLLELQAAWCPHGRYRAPRWDLAPPPRLLPGETALVETIVACDEPPGTVVENAFVIFRARWGDEPWRILVRLEIRADSRGTPENAVALITTQPIGFAPTGDASAPAPAP